MHLGLFISQELTLANRNPWLKNILSLFAVLASVGFSWDVIHRE